jgi:hypothetical protein
MYQTGINGNVSKKPLSRRLVSPLVRLTRRDLGLGQAGLAVVRALVLGGGDALGAGRGRAAAAADGEGGGSRFSRGGDATMGLGRRNLV